MCLTTTGDLVVLGDPKWPDHNDGFVDIFAVKNHLLAVRRVSVVFLDNGNQVGGSVPIDRICVGYRGIVGESGESLYTLAYRPWVLLASVEACAVTGNSTCRIRFKNKARR